MLYRLFYLHIGSIHSLLLLLRFVHMTLDRTAKSTLSNTELPRSVLCLFGQLLLASSAVDGGQSLPGLAVVGHQHRSAQHAQHIIIISDHPHNITAVPTHAYLSESSMPALTSWLSRNNLHTDTTHNIIDKNPISVHIMLTLR